MRRKASIRSTLVSPRGRLVLGIVFGVFGVALLLRTQAATTSIGLQASGGSLSGDARVQSDANAFSQSIVTLHSASPTPNSSTYASNLAFIRSALGTRNDEFLQSPYRQTPSANLDISALTDPVGINSGYAPDPLLGSFRTVCYFSHLAYDDPIVFPGQPGVSHLHMFFGNDETNAYTTADTILNQGSSTCHGHELNRTTYWVPAVFDSAGNVRIPDRMFVYYKSFGNNSVNTQPYPKDASLRIIAGNAAAEAPQDYTNVVQWVCGGRTNADKQPTIPSCGEGGLTGNVKFPQCWNGQTGWASGVTHMAMAVGDGGYYAGNCPATHPILLPSIEVFLEYDKTPGGTDGWFIASDVRQDGTRKTGGVSLHGDWWDGWNDEVNKTWISKCTAALYNCGLVSHIGDNRSLKGWEKIAIDLQAGQPDYTGVRVIAPDKIAQLCPQDTYAQPGDLAWCKARLADAPASVQQQHAAMGHVSGASVGH